MPRPAAAWTAVLLALAGCRATVRAYDGPERAPEELATLKAAWEDEKSGWSFVVLSIDGMPLDCGSVFGDELSCDVELSPGEHAFLIGVRRGDAFTRRGRPARATLAAGGTYEPHGRVTSGDVEKVAFEAGVRATAAK
jgi:hypothetical protein